MLDTAHRPLPCPFCGSSAMARWDGPDARPFSVCCSSETCPGHRPSVTFAEADVAMAAWNRRAQIPRQPPESVHHLAGFTTKALIKGEMVCFDLDRTGVLISEKMQFDPSSRALMLKPSQ